MNNTNTIKEAKRYLENARELLSQEAKKEDGYYQDTKYVNWPVMLLMLEY